MKKILILILIFSSIFSFAQRTSLKSYLVVSDSITPFGFQMSVNMMVLDSSNNKLWRLNESAIKTKTLTTTLKKIVNVITDTTSLSNRINKKINISDTNTFVSTIYYVDSLVSSSSSSTSPGGVDGNIQYNNIGAFGGFGTWYPTLYHLQIGGQNHFIDPVIYYSSIFGGLGDSIWVGNSNIIASYYSKIRSASSYSYILGGYQCEIGNTSTYAGVLGGRNNYITNGVSSTIIQGVSDTIDGVSNVSIGGGNYIQGSYNRVVGLGNSLMRSNYVNLFGTNYVTVDTSEKLTVIGGDFYQSVTDSNATYFLSPDINMRNIPASVVTDSILFYKNGFISKGKLPDGIDTTSLSNRIDTKINITDTNTYVASIWYVDSLVNAIPVAISDSSWISATVDTLYYQTLIDATPTRTVLPDELSGLKMWLIADSSFTSGGYVDSCYDESGNGNMMFQKKSTQRPAYIASTVNGHSAWRFDGTNDYMKLKSIFTSTSQTAFIVLKTFAASATDILLGDSSAASNNYYIYTGDPYINSTLGGAQKGITGAYNAWNSCGYSYGTANITTFYQHGGCYGQITNCGNLAFKSFGNYNNTLWLKGDVAEIIVYNKALTKEELYQINKYISDKYAINEDIGDTIVNGKGIENSIVLIGDSYVEQGDSVNGVNKYVQTVGEFNWGNAYLGHPFQVLLNKGVPSNITSDVLERLTADVIAYNPKYCYVHVGIVDVYKDVPTNFVVNNIKEISQRLIDADIIPIMNMLSFFDAAAPPVPAANKIDSTQKINTALRRYFQSKNILFIDAEGATLEPSSATVSYKTNSILLSTAYAGHPLGYGSMLFGKQMASDLSGKIPYRNYFSQNRYNPYVLFSNSMLYGVSGSSGSGVSGDIATGWKAEKGAAQTVVASKDSTSTDMWQVLKVTGASNDTVTFGRIANIALVAGDTIYGQCEIVLDSTIGLKGCTMKLQVGTTTYADLYYNGTSSFPDEVGHFYLKTKLYTIGSSATYSIRLSINTKLTSGYIYIKNLELRKAVNQH